MDNFGLLQKIDSDSKPVGLDDELLLARHYYDDSSRQPTLASLARLGVGLRDNQKPLQISLLRRIIDRLAVLYDRVPNRWQVGDDRQRVSETSVEHQNFLDIYERASIDMAMRRVDRLKALLRSPIVRVYPVDSQRTVALRVFEPYNVMRHPSAETPDVIDEDHQFALRLAGGEGSPDEVWEHWYRKDGLWHMRLKGADGETVEDSSFLGDTSPYEELPVHVFYDEYPCGQAWLSPRFSRVSSAEGINAIANDLWALIVHEAHTTKVLKSDMTGTAPKESGPGSLWQIGTTDDFQQLASNPKLQECLQTLEALIRLWTLSEDLPSSEFDRTKTIVTGAARKVEMAPLIARRETQLPLARKDEKALYRKIRAVHNVNAAAWGLLPLGPDNIDVEFGPMNVPSDEVENLAVLEKDLQLGFKSQIDAIQERHQLTRREAVAKAAQIASDNAMFQPPEPQSEPEEQEIETTDEPTDDEVLGNRE